MELLTTSRRDQVLELRKAGLSYAEIGRRLGISHEWARQIATGKPTKRRPEKPPLESKVMLRTGEVAQLLNVHVNTVRSWSQKGILIARRVGPRGDRRFRREDIESFLKR